MKRVLLASVYSVLAAWPVAAADMAVKSRDVAPALVPVCGAGGYIGIGTNGAAGAVSNSPVPGASIVQGELGVTLGYTGTIGTCVPGVASPFWFVEGSFNWVNMNGATQGLALTGPLHFQQRIGYGTPAITQVLSSIPGLGGFSTPSLPVLPAGVTSTTSIPYLALAVNEQDVSAQYMDSAGNFFRSGKVWAVSPELQVGMWNRLSNQVVVDVYAGYRIQATGACLGGGFNGIGSGCPGQGNMWTAGVKFDF